jgi:hypothetical protein
MSDFRIWGKIHQLAPSEFQVVASAIADPLADEAMVRIAAASTKEEAELAMGCLMRELGAIVVNRGDRVVDVEEDGLPRA